MKEYIILVLNPGSTSTKIAIYKNTEELISKNLHHPAKELSRYDSIQAQLGYRYGIIRQFMEEAGYPPDRLDCIISRGGAPPFAKAGATVIDENFLDALVNHPLEQHPAGLGPVIADELAREGGIPAYIYDPVTANELLPQARLGGIKDMERDSMCHILNGHAQGIAVARELGRKFEEMNLIVAHFGGGNSVCAWVKGHPVDVVPGDACSFSAERCGLIRGEKLLDMVKEEGVDKVRTYFHGKGGIVSWLGTNDLRSVEEEIQRENEQAVLIEQAMAYQLSKSIISLMPAADGAFDGIILTGGGANWRRLTDDVSAHLTFLQLPIYIRPGEKELSALAGGAYRVMTGAETAHRYGPYPKKE